MQRVHLPLLTAAVLEIKLHYDTVAVTTSKCLVGGAFAAYTAGAALCPGSFHSRGRVGWWSIGFEGRSRPQAR